MWEYICSNTRDYPPDGKKHYNKHPMHYRQWGAAFGLFFTWCGYSPAQNLVLEKLHIGINSSTQDEIAPCVSPDGQTLYFTRAAAPDFDKTLIEHGNDLSQTLSTDEYQQRLEEVYQTLAGKRVPDPATSAFNQDIWIARSSHSEFDEVNHPGYPLNNALPNSLSSLTPRDNEVYVLNQFVQEGGMRKGFSRMTQQEDGSWSFPEPVEIDQYHNHGPDVNMTMSADGQVLILSMERQDGYGKSDLFICFKKGDHQWTMPRNLGIQVNSAYRETTPHLTMDMRQLYFSSDRNNYSGDADIFVIERIGEGWENWTAPRRFRAPINSNADDSHPYYCESTGYLYFTSKRDGSSDIFRVKIAKPQLTQIVLTGKVLDGQTMEAVAAKVRFSLDNDASGYQLFRSSDGTFKVALKPGKKYRLVVTAPGYHEARPEIWLDPNNTGDWNREIQVLLQPAFVAQVKPAAGDALVARGPQVPEENAVYTLESIKQATVRVGQRVDLQEIYFEQSLPAIKPESYAALAKLGSFLRHNSDVYIRIEGHTDNVGEEKALLKLSEARANAIRDYLIYKELIKPVRIAVTGMGASQPKNDNSTEALRQMNRRVEIVITDVTSLTNNSEK